MNPVYDFFSLLYFFLFFFLEESDCCSFVCWISLFKLFALVYVYLFIFFFNYLEHREWKQLKQYVYTGWILGLLTCHFY